jgi:hypothetical protein
MVDKAEILKLRLEGDAKREREQLAFQAEKVAQFEANCQKAMDELDANLVRAAERGHLELKLVSVDVPGVINYSKVTCIDRTRQSTFKGSSGWSSVNPYQNKDVIFNAVLLSLWEKLTEKGLRPIFIEGAYGSPVFGVQLPDGGPYPRNDSAADVAFRTMNRIDYRHGVRPQPAYDYIGR